MNAQAEPTMIGLSEKCHAALKRLKEDGHFQEMADAYRFGVALALRRGVVPGEVPAPRTTIFSVGTIDPDKEIAFSVRMLMDVGDTPVYKWVERLAEWGVAETSTQADGGALDVQALLASDSSEAPLE